ALRDHVLLNVRRPAADHVGRPPEHHALPLAVVDRVRRLLRQHAVRALDVARESAGLDLDAGADELVDRRLGAERLAAELFGEKAETVETHRLDLRLHARQTLADAGIVERAAAAAATPRCRILQAFA